MSIENKKMPTLKQEIHTLPQTAKHENRDVTPSIKMNIAMDKSPTEQPSAPAKITVRNFNFYYGKFHALKNINVDIVNVGT